MLLTKGYLKDTVVTLRNLENQGSFPRGGAIYLLNIFLLFMIFNMHVLIMISDTTSDTGVNV